MMFDGDNAEGDFPLKLEKNVLSLSKELSSRARQRMLAYAAAAAT